jgi:hypothetical protein
MAWCYVIVQVSYIQIWNTCTYESICNNEVAVQAICISFVLKCIGWGILAFCSLGTTNKISLFLNLFISIKLYMFRMEPPPIIRSSDCTNSFWSLSKFAAVC